MNARIVRLDPALICLDVAGVLNAYNAITNIEAGGWSLFWLPLQVGTVLLCAAASVRYSKAKRKHEERKK